MFHRHFFSRWDPCSTDFGCEAPTFWFEFCRGFWGGFFLLFFLAKRFYEAPQDRRYLGGVRQFVWNHLESVSCHFAEQLQPLSTKHSRVVTRQFSKKTPQLADPRNGAVFEPTNFIPKQALSLQETPIPQEEFLGPSGPSWKRSSPGPEKSKTELKKSKKVEKELKFPLFDSFSTLIFSFWTPAPRGPGNSCPTPFPTSGPKAPRNWSFLQLVPIVLLSWGCF